MAVGPPLSHGATENQQSEGSLSIESVSRDFISAGGNLVHALRETRITVLAAGSSL